MTESVEVSARGVLLDSETSTLGQVIQSKQITELPLLGRNPYALAMLVAGARPTAGVNNVPVDQITTSYASINGQRGNANAYLLDGAPNSAPSQNQPVIFASVDAVQEFKVETNAFSAEYGRAAGGVFNVITKSGTNDLHFNLYEFLRNKSLNANDWFANRAGQERPPFRFNQFGGTFGAPLSLPKIYNGRNRTFVFASVELVRFVEGVTFTGTLPTADQLSGDFRRTLNSSGQLIRVYDPLTTRQSGNNFTRDLFPDNVIPASRFDPVAVAMSKFIPPPNTAGQGSQNVNNYARTDGNRFRKDTFSVRLDHHFNERNRLFGRVSWDDSPITRAVAYGPQNVGSPGDGRQIFERRNAVVEDTHTFSPSLVGTFRFSFTRLGNGRRPFSDGFDLTSLGLPGSLVSQIDLAAFPRVTVTGVGVGGGLFGGTDIIALANNSSAWQANLHKSFRSHNLKTGYEYRVIQLNNYQTARDALGFNFTPAWTQGPNPAQSSATAGAGIASFLLGVASGSIAQVPAVAQQSTYYGLFVQDDWRITNSLTLNLGLRYDYESPRTDRYNQLTNFDFNGAVPLNAPGLNLRGALAFPGTDGSSRLQANPDRNNIAPRFGFAYKAGQRTVLRGGYGLFFAANTGIGTGTALFGVSGFEATTTLVTSLDGVTPLNFLSNPYPDGLIRPTGSSQGAATLLGQNVNFFDRGNVIPYAQQWNFGIQRSFPGSLVWDVGYAGSRGLKFPQNRTLNQIPDEALNQGAALRTLVPNPFFGQIQAGPLAQRTVSRAQLLRPFPHFANVTSSLNNWANSTYHALQTKLERRYSKGFTALVSYTFSKTQDYAPGPWAGEDLGGGGFQNWNNLAADWAVSDLDQTHRFIVNGVWELPFAKSRKGFAWQLVKGWQLGGIYSAFSGGPIGVGANVNNTFSQGGGQRPNWTGVTTKLDSPGPDRWFDTAQFSTPSAYTFGNAPRTFGGSRIDGTGQVDLVASKNTTIAEKWLLQFRAEFFNISNSPRFGPPGVSFGPAQFGVVGSQGNEPRIVQFGLKLSY